jgi:hypothetical protein
VRNALKRAGVAAFILAAAPAFAQERIAGEGEVVTLNPDMNAFSLRRADTGDEPDVRILTDNRTRFSGIDALDDLYLGERVLVSAERNERTGTWDAHAVAVSPRQEAPPAPREDVITDEVIRSDRSSLAPLAVDVSEVSVVSEEPAAPAAAGTPSVERPAAVPTAPPTEASSSAGNDAVPPSAAPDAESAPALTPTASNEDTPAPTASEPTDQNKTPH